MTEQSLPCNYRLAALSEGACVRADDRVSYDPMQPGSDAVIDGPYYRPYRWAAADFQLGLRPLRPKSWILIGAEHAAMMRQKRERLDAFRQFYYRALPDSLPAQRELRERVTAHLAADHPGSFERRGSLVRSLITGQALDLDDNSTEPLLQLSYLIEEDFMLLDEVGRSSAHHSRSECLLQLRSPGGGGWA